MVGVLQNKVVVITGAGNGIGRAMALEAGREGASVVVNDIGTSITGQGQDSSPGQAVVDEIMAGGGKSALSTESVASWAGAQAIVQTALDEFGRIDGIVNNAGILRDRYFFNMEPEEWEAVIAVHLNGSFYVSRAAAPHFRAQNGGAMVHMTSTTGLIGNLAQANYGAAKAGIAAMSKCIAMDMARFGVRSNCISPFAWSRMTDSIPTDTPEAVVRVEKLKRMEVEKIAPLACSLLSDELADVTGQIFAVRANEIFPMSQMRPIRSAHRDGGWTARTITDHAMPAFRPNFYALDKSADVFSWDPV